MKTLKVLHLVVGLDVGGTELMLLKTLPDLNRHFDNRVCCLAGQGRVAGLLEKKGIRVYTINPGKSYNPVFIWRFWRLLRDLKPDILVTYLIHADLFGRIAGRLGGVPKIVCSCRGSLLNWEWLRTVDRFTSFLVDNYFVQSRTALAEIGGKLHISKSRMVVIPNGIDLTVYREPKLPKPAGMITIICVAALRQGKGHRVLLAAYRQVWSVFPRTRLLLVGEGALEKDLKAQTAGLDCRGSIHFLGLRQDIPDLLGTSDIFVLPTEGEGMSNAVLEAMASGLPVLTTDIGVNREIITNGQNGFLVPVGDTDALAARLTTLVEDAGLRTRAGRQARVTVQENYDLHKINSRLAGVLESLNRGG